jgi:hypothetical protein
MNVESLSRERIVALDKKRAWHPTPPLDIPEEALHRLLAMVRESIESSSLSS